MNDDDARDPRWPFSFASLRALARLPLMGLGRRLPPPSMLASVRNLWIAFMSAVLVYGVVVLFTPVRDDGSSSTPWLLGMAVVTVVDAVATGALLRRPYDCGDIGHLLNQYRTRYFATLALAEPVALLGLVATFVTRERWLYLIAVPIALADLWRVAPTDRHLAEFDERLAANGCPHSLAHLLREAHLGPPP